MAQINGLFGDVNFSNLLKKVYESKAQLIVKSNSSAILAMIGTNVKRTGGQDHNYLAEIGLQGGIVSGGNSRLATDVKASSGINHKLVYNDTNILGTFVIGEKEIATTNGTTEAFMGIFDRQFNGHMRSHTAYRQRLTAGGQGKIAELVVGTHTFDAASKTITLKTLDNDRLEVGIEISVYDFGNSTVKVAEAIRAKVIGVSPSKNAAGNYEVVIIGQDSDLTANLVTTANTWITELSQSDINYNGLETLILEQGNTVGGVDRSLAQNSWFRAVTLDAGAANLDEEMIRKVKDRVQKNSQSPMFHMLAKHEVVSSFEKTLQGVKSYEVNGATWDTYAAGYVRDTLSFDGAPIIKDRMATRDTMYGIDPSSIDKLETKPFSFLDRNGTIFQKQAGYYWASQTMEFSNLAIVNNMANFTITNIKTDAL